MCKRGAQCRYLPSEISGNLLLNLFFLDRRPDHDDVMNLDLVESASNLLLLVFYSRRETLTI